MEYISLGKTNLIVSNIGFGCIPITRLTHHDAVVLLHYAFDKGITFYDTANGYFDSEEKLGKAFSKIRSKVIIATKSLKRDAKGITEHLELSLKRLKTDYIDLYQLHQVSKEEDFKIIFSEQGAIEALSKAKEEGKIRHIGVTSHNDKMAVRLIKTGIFETIQFPFNFIERQAEKELFVEAKKNNIGIIVMKPFGGGALDNGKVALKFLRVFKYLVPIPGFEEKWQIDEAIDIYSKNEIYLDENDLKVIEQYRNELGKLFCRRCEYCMPCPSGVIIPFAMQFKSVVKRMHKDKVLSFSNEIESVNNCIECGECIKKCPYELPIPEVIKQNYDVYKSLN
jgi:predicted aldo/keto reductase-like oxidoreductase